MVNLPLLEVPIGDYGDAEPAMVRYREEGDRRAREILMLCDEIPAAQAAEWGLVNRAVPAAALDGTVDELVDSLARKLPQTVRYMKHQLNFWRDLALMIGVTTG